MAIAANIVKVITLGLGAVVLATWLLLEPIAKHLLERQLSSANGAEANIGSLDLSLLSASFALTGVDLTNPAIPSRNRLSAAIVSGDLDLGKLLGGNLHIDRLVVGELSTGAQRRSPGYVLEAADPQQNPGLLGLSLEDVALPDVDQLMASNQLQTTAAAEELENAYLRHRSALEKSLKALPDKAKLKAYEDEIKAVKRVDFKDPTAILQAKEKMSALKQRLEQDKRALAAFRSMATEAKTDITQKIATLRQAPRADYERLSGLLSGDAGAFSGAIGALFGPEFERWSNQLYGPVQSLLAMAANPTQERATSPEPNDGIADVLINHAQVSFLVGGDLIESDWKNITHQHELNDNIPTTFEVKSGAAVHWQEIDIVGNFTVSQGVAKGSQVWSISAIPLQPSSLASDDSFSATLQTALLSSQGHLNLNGEQLLGAASAHLGAIDMQATGSNTLTGALADVIASVDDLTLSADIQGSYRTPAIQLSSDLDERVSKGLKAAVDAQLDAKKAELLASLQAQAAERMGLAEAQLQEVLNWEGDGDQRAGAINSLLDQALASLLQPQKGDLLDALKRKLKF